MFRNISLGPLRPTAVPDLWVVAAAHRKILLTENVTRFTIQLLFCTFILPKYARSEKGLIIHIQM